VEGFTDSVGTDDYSQKLSEQRSCSVRDYLSQNGIAGNLVTAQSPQIICARLCTYNPVILSILILSSCATIEAQSNNNGQHVTILLRNGGRYNGSVVASSPSQLTLAGDDNVRRTLDMRDVKSIEYNDWPATNQYQPYNDRQSIRQTETQSSQAHENHYHPQLSSNTRSSELRAGTQIAVRSEETIDSGRAVEGQGFAAEVVRDVLDSDGNVVIPRGSNAQIIIRSAAQGGGLSGSSDMALDLRTVSVDGRQYEIETVDLLERGKDGVGANKCTAKYVGGGAAIGALIGAIAGQGKGAAIGAGSGAAAGIAGELITKGGSIRLPPETILTFQLDRPLHISSSQAIRSRNVR
jgi:hypothetical protein